MKSSSGADLRCDLVITPSYDDQSDAELVHCLRKMLMHCIKYSTGLNGEKEDSFNLLLGEALVNAFRHARCDRGEVAIKLEVVNGKIVFKVSNPSVESIPKNIRCPSVEAESKRGLFLIENCAEELGGKIRFDFHPNERGGVVELQFSCPRL